MCLLQFYFGGLRRLSHHDHDLRRSPFPRLFIAPPVSPSSRLHTGPKQGGCVRTLLHRKPLKAKGSGLSHGYNSADRAHLSHLFPVLHAHGDITRGSTAAWDRQERANIWSQHFLTMSWGQEAEEESSQVEKKKHLHYIRIQNAYIISRGV